MRGLPDCAYPSPYDIHAGSREQSYTNFRSRTLEEYSNTLIAKSCCLRNGEYALEGGAAALSVHVLLVRNKSCHILNAEDGGVGPRSIIRDSLSSAITMVDPFQH